MTNSLQTDIAIIGGSFGGVAAALAATGRGRRVVLTDEYDWIGGQVTSQALCVLDELYDPTGETIMNRTYAEFRQRLRDFYKTRYRLSESGAAQVYFSPGNTAAASVAAEPHVAHAVLQDMLADARAKGLLTILTRHVPIAAEREGDHAIAVTVRDLHAPENTTRIEARFFLDGTETGDTYPLFELPFRIGSEAKADTREEHATEEAEPEAVQSFTMCFVVEFVPGGNFVGEKPADYEKIRDGQPFRLFTPGAKFFDPNFDATGQRIVPFWAYRCVIDQRNFADPAIRYSRAVINVNSNDYHGSNIVGSPRREEIIEEARGLSRAYLHWLRTEAPRDEGGQGYPELRLVPEATGTSDGFAQAPYVREGRRLRACELVVEEDIAAHAQTGSRARHFANSVGLAAYFVDVHKRSGRKPGKFFMARPYQIPLGALVSPQLRNFAVAGKGIGVTQITNGAYRLHTPEWAIGEAAGLLADYCLERQPAHPNLKGGELLDFQRQLLRRGIPLYWYEDLPPEHPAFEAAQLLALTGIWPGDPRHLRFEPQQSICRHRPMFIKVCEKLASKGTDLKELRDLHIVAHGFRKLDTAVQMLVALDRKGWPVSALERTWPAFAEDDHTPLDPARLW